MKRGITALLLAACMTCALLAVPAWAAGSDSGALQTVRALGIIKGDEQGNLALGSQVTRAQFAVMLTAASSYQDSVSTEGSGYSLFKDVKSSHWASEYIRLAVQEGWMVGYTDGTFRPDKTVTLEEACTSVLKLLGYDSASLAGSFPSAQLNKAAALGLRDQISLSQGGAMTRQDCVYLFYNLLTAKNSGGQVYASTLGYTVTNGEVDYTSVLLENLSGPYVAQSGSVSLPFRPVTVYRNGDAVSSSTLSQNDVYYYSESLGILWIYTDRVSGKISQLSPGSTSPTSVTISGVTHQIGSADAAYQLSALSGGTDGKVVTLLLGMDDQVVGVLTGAEASGVYYGVVQSSSRSANGEDSAYVQTEVTVVCTDGVTRTFTAAQDSTYTAGRLVAVNIADGGVTIKGLTKKSTSGQVNSAGTKLGSLSFSEDIQILDVSSEGGAAAIETSRLAGCTLDSDDILYYGLDQDGKVEYLILNDATGDLWTYAYLKAVDDENQDSITYTYMTEGNTQTLRTSNLKYPVEAGGIAISYNADGSIRTMRTMKSVKLTGLTVQWAAAENKKYAVSEDVQVYLRKDGAYYLTDLSSVDAEQYTLTGWYDNRGSPAGGQIRIIVAVERAG